MVKNLLMLALAAGAAAQAPTACRDKTVEHGDGVWFDRRGHWATCDRYARNGGKLCRVQGDKFEQFGMTANEACCACGGGDSVDSSNTLPPQEFACVDKTFEDGGEWHDRRGAWASCSRAYSKNPAKKFQCRANGDKFANEGMTANEACCVCGGGEQTRVCPPRVRKAYSDLNCAEREHFVNALAAFREERGEEWHSFVDTHFAQFTYAHGTSSFLHWHRWFLVNFENALRATPGYECVSIPYWNWDREAGREAEALPLRADTFGSANGPAWFNESEPGFPMGPGVPARCVNDGVAAEWTTATTPFFGATARPGCLLRQNAVPPPQAPATEPPAEWFVSEEVLAGLIANTANFSEWRPMFEGLPHAAPHLFVGGHMLTPWSPTDPLFWMHHANVDRIFTVWQEFHGHDEVAKEDIEAPVHFAPEVDNVCMPLGCVDLAPQGLAPCPAGCNGTVTETCPPPTAGCVVLPPGVEACTAAFCNPTPLFALGADSPMPFGQFPAGPQGVPPAPFWLQGEVTARDMHRIAEMTRESDRYSYGNDALAFRLGQPLVGEWNLVVPAPATEDPVDNCDGPQSCIMQCGTKVPHGWTGQGEGPENHESCNRVMCQDGEIVVLTRRACVGAPKCPPRESLARAASALEAAPAPTPAELCQAAKDACPAGQEGAVSDDVIRRMYMNPATQRAFFTCEGLVANLC